MTAPTGRPGKREADPPPGERRRTRFDHTRRNTFIVLAVIAGVIVVSAVAAFGVDQAQIAPRRNTAVTPRNTDIWAVYPDDTLRHVTLFYQVRSAEDTAPLLVPGPLLAAEDDMLEEMPIGGEIASSELQSGPAQNAEQSFIMYTIDPAPGVLEGQEAYGVNVRTQDAPYIVPAVDGEGQLIQLGTDPDSGYAQVIVAVALPSSAQVTDVPDMQAYRQVRIGDWQVYYFDATAPEEGDVIRVQYTFPEDAPEPPVLDYAAIDRRR